MDPLATLASALIPLGAIITLSYLAACHAAPFRRCSQCTGSGQLRKRIGFGWRECRRCKGTGRRLRAGRHVLNFIRRIHREGTR